MFVYIRARSRFALIGGNLTAQWTWIHRGIGGGIQIPPRRQSTPNSLLTGYIFLGYLDLLLARILLTFGCYCVRCV